MNAERRKLLAEAKQKIEEGMGLIEQALQEEQDYFDNMPESFQTGSKGDAAQTVIDNLQSVYDDVENAVSALDEVEA